METEAAARPPAVVRAVVVDDEPTAREVVRTLLTEHPTVQVVGEATNGKEAVQLVRRLKPDLLFLDIQMPEVNGLDLARTIQSSGTPAVVFVTAYDEYALRAFEVHALDFLLKPFDQTRFEKALERARAQVGREKSPVIDSRIVSLLEELREERKYPERLIVKSSGRVFFVRTEEIDWVEASGNYVKIHTKTEAHLLRESMKNMEAKLDPKTFVRIHRSAIVNIDRIKELEPWFHGEYIVIMRDGTRLTASRVYSDRLSALIE
jgi:two-component system LytT family response regulator